MNELNFISFIAPWYAQPIADLFSKIFDYEDSSKYIQGNPYEAAYSCSIILLLVAMLEGIAVRAASLTKELGSNGKFNSLKYLERKCNKIFFKKELKEIFVVRDAIAHSHLWVTQVSTNPESWMKILKKELYSGFGDDKHKHVFDDASCRTKALQIELVPTKMTKQEALKVFDIVIKSVKCLDTLTNRIMGIDACRISFKKLELSLLSFYEEVKRIAQPRATGDARYR